LVKGDGVEDEMTVKRRRVLSDRDKLGLYKILTDILDWNRLPNAIVFRNCGGIHVDRQGTCVVEYWSD
jgi:hypothetical protein